MVPETDIQLFCYCRDVANSGSQMSSYHDHSLSVYNGRYPNTRKSSRSKCEKML